jgi:hypothetical protein
MSVLDGRDPGWTPSDLSKIEIKLILGLRDVMDTLGGLLRPDTNVLVALALERRQSLRDLAELVETARRSIEVATTRAYPEGVRGAWRRFRSQGNPLARLARELAAAGALSEAVRVVKALEQEDMLAPQTLKLADLTTTLQPFEWEGAAAALDGDDEPKR